MTIQCVLIPSKGIIQLSCDWTNAPANKRRVLQLQYLPYCQPAVCPHEHMQPGPSSVHGICDHTEASRPCRDA
eukprot:6650145-Pyramimonas_sp.AAC.1